MPLLLLALALLAGCPTTSGTPSNQIPAYGQVDTRPNYIPSNPSLETRPGYIPGPAPQAPRGM